MAVFKIDYKYIFCATPQLIKLVLRTVIRTGRVLYDFKHLYFLCYLTLNTEMSPLSYI